MCVVIVVVLGIGQPVFAISSQVGVSIGVVWRGWETYRRVSVSYMSMEIVEMVVIGMVVCRCRCVVEVKEYKDQ
jgi:hypothetical protein